MSARFLLTFMSVCPGMVGAVRNGNFDIASETGLYLIYQGVRQAIFKGPCVAQEGILCDGEFMSL